MKDQANLRNMAVACLAFLVLGVPGISNASETNFNKFVVFGTSLSDPGNYFVETHDVNVAPNYDQDFFGVPGSAYAIGGHHLSNGKTWVEQLATSLGMPGSVQPATRDANPNAMNYAIDGARAAPSPFHARTVLSTQVDTFLADVNGVAPADALYVIEIGSNDVRDALVAFLTVFQATGSIDQAKAEAGKFITTALIQIGANNQKLFVSGARQFFYLSAPALDVAPAIAALDESFGGSGLILSVANTLSAEYSFGLDIVFGMLNAAGAVTTKLDLFSLTSQFVNSPADYGFTNVTEPCITPDVAPFMCQNPDEYLFWDVLHPTRAGHGQVAKAAASILAAH